MKRSLVGTLLVLCTSIACGGRTVVENSGPVVESGRTVVENDGNGLLVVDPIGNIETLTVSPTQGPAGTVATVTWVGGQFTYSVRIAQGQCNVFEDGTASERSCPRLVGVAEDLPARGSSTVVLSATGYVCVFPVRNAGVFPPYGRCVRTTVVP